MVLFISSCCDRCRDNEGSYYSYDLETNVFKNGKRISGQYDSVIAVGLKDSVFIYKETNRFLGDEDSLFRLKLNIHDDTCTFVFIDKLKLRDTVSIAYDIEFFQDWDTYYARFVNMRIIALSSRFSKDSTHLIGVNSAGIGRKLNLIRK